MMASTVGGSYSGGNNIDMSGTTNQADIWRSSTISGSGFLPIGTSNSFTGSFNGQNFIISNLYTNRASPVGLFGQTSIGTLQNIALLNTTVIGTGNSGIGALVAVTSSTISNSYSLNGT